MKRRYRYNKYQKMDYWQLAERIEWARECLEKWKCENPIVTPLVRSMVGEYRRLYRYYQSKQITLLKNEKDLL